MSERAVIPALWSGKQFFLRQTTRHNACLYTFCTELVSGAHAGNAKMPRVNSPPDMHVVYMCGLNCTVFIFYGIHTVQCIAIYPTCINLIKRTVSRDFCFWFFSRCTTGINDNGGKFATGINDTGGKFCH